MAHTFDELKGMTVAQLREIAKDVQHEAVQGYSTMHKDHLLPALCTALGIAGHAAHVAKTAEKARIKAAIRALKKQRDAAMAAKQSAQLKDMRHQIHCLKRQLRRSMA